MPRNQYPSICYRCNEIVEPKTGHFERYGGKWRTQHAECAIAYRGKARDFKGPRPVKCGECQRFTTNGMFCKLCDVPELTEDMLWERRRDAIDELLFKGT